MVQRRGRDHEATSLSQEAPMNVGVWIPNCRYLATPEIIRSTAVRAEHLGYDSIWVSDHVVVPHANVVNFGETVFDPLVTLAVVAGATSRVRLGTTVLIVPYRNPVVTAKMISSLDALSGGRFILGIGAGWVAAESVALGVPFPEAGAPRAAAAPSSRASRFVMTRAFFGLARVCRLRPSMEWRSPASELPWSIRSSSWRTAALDTWFSNSSPPMATSSWSR